jgi:cellulose synthase/poly-beta-1,6-N-acetylglucosamine synthase-like glycosyltransferase/mono/diheme cytochrome c family protein
MSSGGWGLGPLQIVVGAAYVITLCGLLIYASNAYVMVAVHWRRRREQGPRSVLPDPLPGVTIQLPLYNERYVATRLLEAVGALDYPRDRLEIQVLDDSTDDTPDIVAAMLPRLRVRGIRVVHCRRAIRTGFKAGALAEGLTSARGEFIAIFDADFVPPPDFLTSTLPYFRGDVAVVQARWGHLNRSFSLLTIAQSLGIDGHFAVEQSARARSSLFLNFNGTAGVWRRAAIEDAGGWTHDTLTEDLDLSYRAQLRGWKIVYRPDIVCPAELPVVISGFKSQQRRWAKGSIQTAIKLLPRVWAAPLPGWIKYQAFVHLTYYMIHPLMLAGLLLAMPLGTVWELTLGGGWRQAAGLLFMLATLGPGTMLVYSQWVLRERWWQRIWQLPTIMVIGVGVALSTSLAVIDAFVGRRGDFVRTPKFGIAGRQGTWRGKGYGRTAPWGGIAELMLGTYCAIIAGIFWHGGQYAVAPFVTLYAAGFFTVGLLTVGQSLALPPFPRARAVALGLGLAGLIGGTASPARGAELPTSLLSNGRTLVAEGERWWRHSPDPGNPVACATCHDDIVAVRSWAPSFPKWKPMPPPYARVMTLLQVNAEAVTRHYRQPDARPAAIAITAYLTWLARNLPLRPGISAGQPIFPARLEALRRSVERGSQLFDTQCGVCHEPVAVAGEIAAFPRVVRGRGEGLEGFVEDHVGKAESLEWDTASMADLVAYLVSRRATPTVPAPVGRPTVAEQVEVSR